jgi:hypothetical protein
MKVMINRKPSDRHVGMPAIVPWVQALLSRTHHDAAWRPPDALAEERRFRRACTVFETTLAAGLLILIGLAVAMAFSR